jgi:hypothetical protein
MGVFAAHDSLAWKRRLADSPNVARKNKRRALAAATQAAIWSPQKVAGGRLAPSASGTPPVALSALAICPNPARYFAKLGQRQRRPRHHILAERARNGTTGPEPVPHPDEVIIDLQTLEVRIEGPVLQEQKEARDHLHANRLEMEEELREIEEKLASDPNNPQLRKMQKRLTRIVNLVRQDALKRNLRKATKAAMPKTTNKSAEWMFGSTLSRVRDLLVSPPPLAPALQSMRMRPGDGKHVALVVLIIGAPISEAREGRKR